MPENNPATDAELAEVKRLRALTTERDQLQATINKMEAEVERDNEALMKLIRTRLGKTDVHGAFDGVEQLAAEVERLRGESEVWLDGLKLSGEIFDRVTAERDAATTRATTAEAQLAHWKKQHDIELLTADGLANAAAGLRRALEAGKADRWAATAGNTETNAFAPSPWVLMAETALAASPDDHERRNQTDDSPV